MTEHNPRHLGKLRFMQSYGRNKQGYDALAESALLGAIHLDAYEACAAEILVRNVARRLAYAEMSVNDALSLIRRAVNQDKLATEAYFPTVEGLMLKLVSDSVAEHDVISKVRARLCAQKLDMACRAQGDVSSEKQAYLGWFESVADAKMHHDEARTWRDKRYINAYQYQEYKAWLDATDSRTRMHNFKQSTRYEAGIELCSLVAVVGCGIGLMMGTFVAKSTINGMFAAGYGMLPQALVGFGCVVGPSIVGAAAGAAAATVLYLLPLYLIYNFSDRGYQRLDRTHH